jgi:hypothetical protein
LWLIPLWLAFMFPYGILVETRVWGELIPLVVCATAVICEEILMMRMRVFARRSALAVVDAGAEKATKVREAA